MKKNIALVVSVLGFVFCFAAVGYAQSGGNFSLTWSTIAGGGGTASGGAYSVAGTLGQPIAGSASGGAYGVESGYQSETGSTPVPTSTATYTNTPTNTSTPTTINTATRTSTSTNTPMSTFTRTSTATNTATHAATSIPTDTQGPTSTRTSTATSTHTHTTISTATYTLVPTSTRTATATNTAASTATTASIVTATGTPGCTLGQDYTYTATSGATIVPGISRVPGSTCNSCTVTLSLPFAYSFYGTPYSQVNVSNKGVLQFLSGSSDGNNTCLPNAGFNDAIYAYWDDHNTNINDTMGMFTSISGTAPNRIFNIEWRTGYVANDVRSRFEVRLYEGDPKFEIIYGATRRGFSATVGVQKGTGERVTQYACNVSNSVPNGTKITFDQWVCPGSRPGKP